MLNIQLKHMMKGQTTDYIREQENLFGCIPRISK